MERNLFVGSNTFNGFINLFDEYIDRRALSHLFIMKGGSGVGKSTMIKKVLSSNKGEREIFHCAGDLDSLDGAYLKDKNVVIFDGTAPHVLEVIDKNKESYIDFSDCISQDIDSKKESIHSLQDKAKAWYNKGYTYLNEIEKTQDIVVNKLLQNINEDNLKKFIEILDSKFSLKNGKKKFLFDGVMGYSGVVYSIKKYDNVVSLIGQEQMRYIVLNILAEHFKEKQLEIYYSPLSIKNVSAIKFNDNCIFTSSMQSDIKVNVCQFFNSIVDCTEVYFVQQKLLKNAQECFINARFYHQEIEKIYRPFVDFDKVDALTDKIILDINNL